MILPPTTYQEWREDKIEVFTDLCSRIPGYEARWEDRFEDWLDMQPDQFEAEIARPAESTIVWGMVA